MRTMPDHGEGSYVGKGMMTDRAALITGGDSGIGRAVAIAFAREGADVAISYLEDEQADAEDTRDWVERAGRRCLLLPGDIRDAAHCRGLVARTVETFGRIDVLVNNAAAQTMNEHLDDIEEASVEGAFRANVFAQLWLAQAAAKHMKPGAAIVNTTSVQAKVASETMIVYCRDQGRGRQLDDRAFQPSRPEGHPRELRGTGSGVDADPADREITRRTGDARAERTDRSCRPAGRACPRLRPARDRRRQLHVGCIGPRYRRDADAVTGCRFSAFGPVADGPCHTAR